MSGAAPYPSSVAGASSSSGGGMKDFSVDAQRRMFIEKQAREKQLAEEARSRKHSNKSYSSSSHSRGVGKASSRGVVGDDDDDSINNNQNNKNNDDDDDAYSLDSEESFYVGIERADYTQPDNFSLYGGGVGNGDNNSANSHDANRNEDIDRLGISHNGSIAIIHRQQGEGGITDNKNEKLVDWDADIPILYDEKNRSSSLHAFMNGSSGAVDNVGAGKSKKNMLVAMPLVGSGTSGTTNLLNWNEDHVLKYDNARGGENSDDQVYQHKAAEGKMFIDKILSAPTTNAPATTMAPTFDAASTTVRSSGGGTYPTLSPLQMYIPGISVTGNGGGGGGGNAAVKGEDNFMRQLRERELRREENARVVARTMQEMRDVIASAASSTAHTDAESTETTIVDANALMKRLEELMVE